MTECLECAVLRDVCIIDCSREIANTHDEMIHNTGECGCKEARSLCWRKWNNEVCCVRSPYDGWDDAD